MGDVARVVKEYRLMTCKPGNIIITQAGNFNRFELANFVCWKENYFSRTGFTFHAKIVSCFDIKLIPYLNIFICISFLSAASAAA